MTTISLSSLVPILQLSIGPVILISGVGLLLLTLTNRFGRMLDRSRALKGEMSREPDGSGMAKLNAQIGILQRRATLLKISITLAAVTVLLGRATMSQLNAVPVSGIRFELDRPLVVGNGFIPLPVMGQRET